MLHITKYDFVKDSGTNCKCCVQVTPNGRFIKFQHIRNEIKYSNVIAFLKKELARLEYDYITHNTDFLIGKIHLAKQLLNMV